VPSQAIQQDDSSAAPSGPPKPTLDSILEPPKSSKAPA